jgi:PfaB family protein
MNEFNARADDARDVKLAITGIDYRSNTIAGRAAYFRSLLTGEQLTATNDSIYGERVQDVARGALLDAGVNEPVSLSDVGSGGHIGFGAVDGAFTWFSGNAAGAADCLKIMRSTFEIADRNALLLIWAGEDEAAAVVLQRQHRRGKASYALITSMGSYPLEQRPGLNGVGYLHVLCEDMQRLDMRVDPYRLTNRDKTVALAVDSENLVLGLIKAALSLHHRVIFPSPAITVSEQNIFVESRGFYFPHDARTWFIPTGKKRQAAVDRIGGHEIVNINLEQDEGVEFAVSESLCENGVQLFPLAAGGQDEILQKLTDLQSSLEQDDFLRVARRTYEDYSANAAAPYTAVIAGRSGEEAAREAAHALRGIPSSYEKQSGWATPLGSVFQAAPVGRQGGVAFVFPGAFNSYPGAGRDLFHLFPILHKRLEELTSDPGAVMVEHLLHPRFQTLPSAQDVEAAESQLTADPVAMLISGTTLSVMYTHVLRDVFNVHPSAAFGYSLGENSMIFAMGVWAAGDAVSERLTRSPLFKTRLSGPQNAVREYWGLPVTEAQQEEEPLWRNYLLMTEAERVQAALENEPRVYLTHINTPRQVVIGGDPAGCLRVIQSLKGNSLMAPFDHALHNPAMKSEYARLAILHDWPLENVPTVNLYTAAHYGRMNLERSEIARNIAAMLCSSLDFPRLIEQVYNEGSRVFIELGAGSNCARWVDESLKGRPHVSVSVNRRGVDDRTSIVRALAVLVSQRVEVNLAPLYALNN